MTKLQLRTAKPKTKPKTHDSLKKYREVLRKLRYYKLFDSKSREAQICQAINMKDTLPASWLMNDFFDYCRDNELDVPDGIKQSDLLIALETVVGAKFEPGEPELIESPLTRGKYVNTYQGFTHRCKPIELSETFHNFFNVFIADETERKILFEYIAHIVQRPEERPSWHLMMPADAGLGKGFLFNDILTPLLNHAVLISRFDEVMGKFATILGDTTLIWLDDCKAKSRDTQTELKSILSEERQMIEPKNLAARMVNCYSRMILASNEDVPLFIDAQERRWCIFKRLTYCNSLPPKEGKQHRKRNYITPLSKWLKLPGAIEAVHKFFAEYDITNFDHKDVPYTTSFDELVENSKRIEHVMLEDWLESRPDKLEPFQFSKAQAIFEHTHTHCPAPQILAILLRECGYQQHRFQGANKHLGTLWFPNTVSKEQVAAERNRAPNRAKTGLNEIPLYDQEPPPERLSEVLPF